MVYNGAYSQHVLSCMQCAYKAAGHQDTVVSRCRIYEDPQAGSQKAPANAT